MATHTTITFIACPTITPPTENLHLPSTITFNSTAKPVGFPNSVKLNIATTGSRRNVVRVSAIGDRTNSSTGGDASSNTKGKTGSAVPNSNYVVPFDSSPSCITRPLIEILRDLNKRIHDNIIVKQDDSTQSSFIPWYHANRMLSFYAPGWCGEIRDVIFSDNGSVTVVYRVTVRGSDAEAYRESTGTVSAATIGEGVDPVAAAEEIAFCKACARFGLGLYLYHED
ncbi:putative DNA repair RAD52-like protein [Helianthus anomalus]